MTAGRLRQLHGWAAVIWGVLAIPTAVWWPDALLWVTLVSVYANVVSHWAAWQTARVDAPDGSWLRAFHGWATVAWVGLTVPTVLLWADSVLWLSLISVYANAVSHAGAWLAARVEEDR